MLTTVNSEYDRVAMHGTRSSLLKAQAKAAGLPLWTVPLPWPCSNEHYESAMRTAVAQARAERVEAIAFGDLFLEEVRAYREAMLQGSGIRPMFPLWGMDTRQLAEEMIAEGMKAVLVCIDPKQLSSEFAGRQFNAQMLTDLPTSADPCGENGEFHTAVYAGPMFANAIQVSAGITVTRNEFVYTDLFVNAAGEQPIAELTKWNDVA